MKSWIRWWGIFAFIAIIAISVGIWYIFADRIIERNIERTGEYIVGAKVDIGSADLSIIPLGITLENFKVANPNAPMKNLFDVDNVRFHLDGKYLFERKVIIQDMVIEGLKFNTERSTTGEIKGAKPLTIKRAYNDFVMPLLDLSKLKAFIEEEELQSIDNLNEVVNDFNRVKKEWQDANKYLPNMNDVREYQNRTEKIMVDLQNNMVSGFLANGKDIKKLKDEIKHDIEIISINKKAMQIDLDSLKTKKSRALKSVDTDYTYLKGKYTPDIRGLKNFSKYIFKDDILRQIDEGLLWYNRLSPIFDYAYKKIQDDYYASEPIGFDGLDIQLQEYNPKPSFLIELAQLSFEKEYGNLSGEIKNFTVQQSIEGLPTSISLNGNDLNFAKSISFNALIDHINVDNVKDDFTFTIEKQKLEKQKYSIFDNWNLSINEGFVSKDFDIKIHNGKIHSKMKLDFSGTSFISNYGGNDNIIINTIESVIKNLSNFYVSVDINGNPEKYNTIIKSNLDNKIDNAVTSVALREADKAKAVINTYLNKQKDTFIDKFNYEMQNLNLEIAEVDRLNNEINSILRKLP